MAASAAQGLSLRTLSCLRPTLAEQPVAAFKLSEAVTESFANAVMGGSAVRESTGEEEITAQTG